MSNNHVHPVFRCILDHWNPELGNRGDDLSAQAEDFDHSPSCETGTDKPEQAYLEDEARQILADLEDDEEKDDEGGKDWHALGWR